MRALRVMVACVVAVLTVPAGVGFLYGLRSISALAVGPALTGALPLQQLAGGAAQPLLRVAIAWIPAGIVAGLALRRLGRVRAVPAMIGLATVTFVLLIAAGAAADAVAVSERFFVHLGPQFHRAGTWVALMCLLVGAGVASSWPSRRSPSPAAAPTAG